MTDEVSANDASAQRVQLTERGEKKKGGIIIHIHGAGKMEITLVLKLPPKPG